MRLPKTGAFKRFGCYTILFNAFAALCLLARIDALFAIDCRAREQKLSHGQRHEIPTNLDKNSMRSITLGRKNWIQFGHEDAGPKIAAILSVIESCRRLDINPRLYLAEILPGLANISIQKLHTIPSQQVADMGRSDAYGLFVSTTWTKLNDLLWEQRVGSLNLSAPASVKALRPLRGAHNRSALTDAPAAGVPSRKDYVSPLITVLTCHTMYFELSRP